LTRRVRIDHDTPQRRWWRAWSRSTRRLRWPHALGGGPNGKHPPELGRGARPHLQGGRL